MASINTNLSSLIVQNNLLKSTNALNTAIERMTTGYKINHSSDNAANYSISADMSSKLSSYQVAQDNIATGMDLVATAQDTISLMQTHGQRIHALITQAQNGTYGNQSLAAIQSEANARIAEISRLYTNAEYNGNSLFEIPLPDWAQEVRASAGLSSDLSAQCNGFIAEAHTMDDSTVNAMTHVAGLSNFNSGTTFAVSTKEDLANLAALVNSGVDTTGKTFVMGADIDLRGEEWTAIGKDDSAKRFKGTFDGNGHKVSGVTINKESTNFQGLFGYSASSSTIKNVGVEDVDIKGGPYTGGLVGGTTGTVTNCYATGSVSGTVSQTGGLAGGTMGTVTNCYATGSVSGAGNYTGGLVGEASGAFTNCYATGSVSGAGNYTGGLVGDASGGITNCYATGSVSGAGKRTGGLVGRAESAITNSYATGDVTGGDYTGGLAGSADFAITTNSYATGNVTGGDYTGGLVGHTTSRITNSYATGNVTGGDYTGGLVGQLKKTLATLSLDKILSAGTVTITTGNQTGSLIGGIASTSNGTSFSTINITNASALNQGLDMIGFEGKDDGTACQSGQMEGWLSNITGLEKPSTTLQVGINGDNSSQITFETSLSLNLNISDITSNSAYDSINTFLNQLSARATELGAISSRLESALDSTTVAIDNLTSSRSTIKDADIAKESSAYIKAQILQQASATLLATANQSPSIALQLI